MSTVLFKDKLVLWQYGWYMLYDNKNNSATVLKICCHELHHDKGHKPCGVKFFEFL